LIVFYLCSRFLHHKKFISFINARKHVRWKSLVKGAFLWILILGLFSLPSLILDPGSFKVTFNIYSFSFLLILSILTFPIQAFFEEIFFRGYLMQGFSLIFKRAIFPLIITSLLFGLMHFFNGTNTDQSLNIVISTTIMGLMWGLVTLADNGIELAAGSHIANNLYVALIFNPEDSGLTGIPSIITSPASEPFSGILVLLLAAIIFTGVLFWNRRDDLLTALKSKRD
jgi:membrane protease YdiL (CAAX protease family)